MESPPAHGARADGRRRDRRRRGAVLRCAAGKRGRDRSQRSTRTRAHRHGPLHALGALLRRLRRGTHRSRQRTAGRAGRLSDIARDGDRRGAERPRTGRADRPDPDDRRIGRRSDTQSRRGRPVAGGRSRTARRSSPSGGRASRDIRSRSSRMAAQHGAATSGTRIADDRRGGEELGCGRAAVHDPADQRRGKSGQLDLRKTRSRHRPGGARRAREDRRRTPGCDDRRSRDAAVATSRQAKRSVDQAVRRDRRDGGLSARAQRGAHNDA